MFAKTIGCLLIVFASLCAGWWCAGNYFAERFKVISFYEANIYSADEHITLVENGTVSYIEEKGLFFLKVDLGLLSAFCYKALVADFPLRYFIETESTKAVIEKLLHSSKAYTSHLTIEDIGGAVELLVATDTPERDIDLTRSCFKQKNSYVHSLQKST